MANEVVLGYTIGETGHREWIGSLLRAVSGPNADPAIGGVISSSAGPLLALGRNLLVKQFLSLDFDWLLSVDTDIVFSTDTVSRLLRLADPVNRPVVSALYSVFIDGQRYPAAYINQADEGEPLDVVPISEVEAYLDAQHVFAIGAGCMLVHRSVFETIRKDAGGEDCWFREGVIEGRDHGEDISFCIRCAISGFPVFVASNVKVGHMKTALLGEVN
jgi:GT2 family glycosyltransferase